MDKLDVLDVQDVLDVLDQWSQWGNSAQSAQSSSIQTQYPIPRRPVIMVTTSTSRRGLSWTPWLIGESWCPR